MYCYQCEQTGRGGCSANGVCGKDPETAALQDLLVYVARGVAMWASRARKLGAISEAVDRFVADALFTTVTNVNFDPDRIVSELKKADEVIVEAKKLYVNACAKEDIQPEEPGSPSDWRLSSGRQELVREGDALRIDLRIDKDGEDIIGLQELLTYGLKGTAAYSVHARMLGNEDPEVYAFFHEMLSYLAEAKADVATLVAHNLKCGEVNLKVMEMLDSAHTRTYGNPEPTEVLISALKGKAILVSGHDLKDLEELLKQTEGKGINVYTHGEMLPALAYPGLKKYKHLVGNYGGAWQDQAREFDAFPGAILMTTNCIQQPRESYSDRIFTSGLVAWPEVVHAPNHDYSAVIQAALESPGFAADEERKTITIGFGHNAVLGVADKVIAAVKSGAIKHFFLIGGCDGAKSGRNYYTEFAKATPQDSIILTLACGKYRFNKEDFGDIGGIPRLLDMGQCNDAYSAIKVASALAEAFDCGVNDLPLSFILSWYEQKAVCILLTLLHLGIKNMRLGPSLPAFISPAVLDVLVENFNLMPIGQVEDDLKACLGA